MTDISVSSDEQGMIEDTLTISKARYKQNVVKIKKDDYSRLEYGQFLNDNLIEFSVYKVLEGTSTKVNQKIHLFSTQFFTKLISAPKGTRSHSSRMTQSQAQHQNVKRWTKNVNIFDSKKILLFPINEEHFHWYLIMVVIPNLAEADAYITVMDSMGGKKDLAVEEIRSYLIEELKSKKITTISHKTFAEMTTVYPKIPHQPDGSSCGLYLIQCVKMIVSGMENMNLMSIFEDPSSWFESVNKQRFEISEQIKNNSEKNIEIYNLPDLQFFPTAAQDKAAKRERTKERPIPINKDIKKAYFDYLATIKETEKDITLVRKYEFVSSDSPNKN